MGLSLKKIKLKDECDTNMKVNGPNNHMIVKGSEYPNSYKDMHDSCTIGLIINNYF